MEKNLRVEIKAIRDEREYIFSMPYGTLYGESYDACYEILKELLIMAQDALKQSERQKEPTQGGPIDGSK